MSGMKGKKLSLTLLTLVVAIGLRGSPQLKFEVNNFCLGAPLIIHFEVSEADTVLWKADQPGFFRTTDQDTIVEFVWKQTGRGLVEVHITGTALKGGETDSISRRCWGIPIPNLSVYFGAINLFHENIGDTLTLEQCYFPAHGTFRIELDDDAGKYRYTWWLDGSEILGDVTQIRFDAGSTHEIEVGIQANVGCSVTLERTLVLKDARNLSHQNTEQRILIEDRFRGTPNSINLRSREDEAFTFQAITIDGRVLAQSDQWQNHHCCKLSQNFPKNRVVLIVVTFEDGTREVVRRFLGFSWLSSER